jgi:hypothetical protein
MHFNLTFHRSKEDAAHVWDLSAICLGLDTAKLNFPASEYESGGRWVAEAREARRVDITEFMSIWTGRAKQGNLDGVLIVPGVVVASQDSATTGLQARRLASRLEQTTHH